MTSCVLICQGFAGFLIVELQLGQRMKNETEKDLRKRWREREEKKKRNNKRAKVIELAVVICSTPGSH